MNRDEFFQNLFGENTPSAEIIRAQRQLAYEERVIKRIFTECGAAPGSWGLLASQCRRETGENKMHFRWFNDTYTRFPGILCGKRIPYLHQIALPDLFKPIGKNRLAKAIGRVLGGLEIDPLKQPYVLVFPIIKTAFCAYNLGSISDEPAENEQRVQFKIQPADRKNRPLIIEPLKSFCAALGNQWAVE